MNNTVTRRIRRHRDLMSLQRAIANASTPSMRDELLTIASRQNN